MADKFRRFGNLFNNLKIRKKLLLIYLVAGLLPLTCIGTFLVVNTTKIVYQEHTTQIQEENKRVKIILFDSMYVASNLSNILFYDDGLRSLVSTRYANESQVYEAYRNYTMIGTFQSNYSELSGITVYVNNPTLVTNSQFHVADQSIEAMDWYKKAAASNGEILWIVNPAATQDGYLWLVRKIPIDQTYFAVMVISVSNNFLNLMAADSPLHSIAELNGKTIFYSDNYDEIGGHLETTPSWSGTLLPQMGMQPYDGKDALAMSSVLKTVNSADTVQIVTIDRSMPNATNVIALSLSLIVLTSLLIPCVIIVLFSNFFSERIITLRREMHKIVAGDFRIIDEFSGNDELGEYFADMKLMIESVENLYDEMYFERLSKQELLNEQQKMKLEMLTSQINPHFLFNTLETIRMKAFSQGNGEIARIIKLLGKSIRHVLEVKDMDVTLASELEYIRSFIDIQIFRFGDKLNYEIDIAGDVDPEHYLILPLLIQPIVENAIVHGLEDKERDGWVKISVKEADEGIFIVVSDNGVGMSEEKRNQLLENVNASGADPSIGLRNVQQRIRLFYGQQYGIRIDSEPGVGSTVTIFLPPARDKTVENTETGC